MEIKRGNNDNSFVLSGIFNGSLKNGEIEIPINKTSLLVHEDTGFVDFKDSVSGDIYVTEKIGRIVYEGNVLTLENIYEVFGDIATGATGGGSAEPDLNWFKITNLTDEDLDIDLRKIGSPNDLVLKVSSDGKNWTRYDINQATTFTIPYNGYLLFNGKTNTTWSTSLSDYWHFNLTKPVNVSGDLSTLVADSLSSTGYIFLGLFENCAIKDASELILPWRSLSKYCYSLMFSDCTELTAAPELPATILANSCYYYMFQRCRSLTTAPELPATTLALSSDSWARDTYGGMFSGCTSLTTAPSILPATNLIRYCYKSMFYGCTSLTSAPELPATTLTAECYQFMFDGCTSLTSAPELPATSLATDCYREMFYGCSRLNYVKCHYTGSDLPSYTTNWLTSVAPTGTFLKSGYAEWPDAQVIPAGWLISYYDVQPMNISPSSADFGTITTWTTKTETFTLTDLEAADSDWSYSASSNDSAWTYAVSGNTLTVTYTTDVNSTNGTISNTISFAKSGYAPSSATISGTVSIPAIEVSKSVIVITDLTTAFSETVTITGPTNWTATASGTGAQYITLTPDLTNNTLTVDYAAGAVSDPMLATITVSAQNYIRKMITVSLGDEVVGAGCERVEYIQTNNNFEYLNTGVLLAADCSIAIDTWENIGSEGYWTLSTRWQDNENNYLPNPAYHRIFTTGATPNFYWDLHSDSARMSFAASETLNQNRYTMFLENDYSNNQRRVEITFHDSGVSVNSSSSQATTAQTVPLVWANYLAVLYENWNNSIDGAISALNRRLYSLKVWNSGALAFDAIPVIRINDTKPGVYDFVSHSFIPCGGSINMSYQPLV